MAAALELRPWSDTARTDTVRIERLRAGSQLRGAGLDDAHIRLLMELGGRWPPVVVRKHDHRIVDGAHRVEAARRLGLKTLDVVWFEGSAEEAFVEAIRRNVRHGLPLTYSDRLGAATQIVATHPEWSDRRICALCAVSSKTIARIRAGHPWGHAGRADVRIGQDGRSRPVNPASTRERILDALEREPHRSLRSIAAMVGASPETVRSVRNSLRRGPEATPDRPADGSRPVESTAIPGPVPLRPSQSALCGWTTDLAFVSRQDGQEFAAWFESGAVRNDWCNFLTSVPLGRVYEVADEARRRAHYWAEFAQALEARGQRSTLRA